MKKLLLLVGVAIGFVLGSRAGRTPYERLEAQLRQLAGRPEVRGAVDAAFDKATDLTDAAAREVTEKVSHVTASTKNASTSTMPAVPPQPTQDPQDKASGTAASRDQAVVDELEKQGVTAEDLSDTPIRHPRAAGKAEPTASGESAKQKGENEAQHIRDEGPA